MFNDSTTQGLTRHDAGTAIDYTTQAKWNRQQIRVDTGSIEVWYQQYNRRTHGCRVSSAHGPETYAHMNNGQFNPALDDGGRPKSNYNKLLEQQTAHGITCRGEIGCGPKLCTRVVCAKCATGGR